MPQRRDIRGDQATSRASETRPRGAPEIEGRQPHRRRGQQQRRQPRRAVGPQPPPEVYKPHPLPAPRPLRKHPAGVVHLPPRRRSRPSRTAEVCVCVACTWAHASTRWRGKTRDCAYMCHVRLGLWCVCGVRMGMYVWRATGLMRVVRVVCVCDPEGGEADGGETGVVCVCVCVLMLFI